MEEYINLHSGKVRVSINKWDNEISNKAMPFHFLVSKEIL